MIKLKPIAEQILQEEEEQTPTWGEVYKVLQVITTSQNKKELGDGLLKLAKSGIKIAANLATGGAAEFIQSALELSDDLSNNISSISDSAKALLQIGKALSLNQLKNPTASKFKKLTGPLWAALRIDPEISVILDDQLEAEFINTQIVPKLQQPGSENERLPNMNYELGKWLNDKQKLRTKDIFFKGQDQEI